MRILKARSKPCQATRKSDNGVGQTAQFALLSLLKSYQEKEPLMVCPTADGVPQ